MSEEEIAQKLKQNIPTPSAPNAPAEPHVLVDEPSSIVENAVNELNLLKMGNSLGLDLMPNNIEVLDKLKFIYEQISVLTPDGKLETVMEKLNDLLVRLGYKFSEDRFMKLYLWLKLNQERMAIEQEMMNLHG